MGYGWRALHQHLAFHLDALDELSKEDVLRLRLEDKLAALQAEVERAWADGDADAAEAAHARYIELGTTYVRRFVRPDEPAA